MRPRPRPSPSPSPAPAALAPRGGPPVTAASRGRASHPREKPRDSTARPGPGTERRRPAAYAGSAAATPGARRYAKRAAAYAKCAGAPPPPRLRRFRSPQNGGAAPRRCGTQQDSAENTQFFTLLALELKTSWLPTSQIAPRFCLSSRGFPESNRATADWKYRKASNPVEARDIYIIKDKIRKKKARNNV